MPVPGEGGGGEREERELCICVRPGAARGGAAWHVRIEYEHFPQSKPEIRNISLWLKYVHA
jgi:hypothetical protein